MSLLSLQKVAPRSNFQLRGHVLKPFENSNNRPGSSRNTTFTVQARRGRHQWWSDSWMEPLKTNIDEEIITIFASDGTITTVPPFVPRTSDLEKPSQLHSLSLPTPEDQGICIGSIFTIKATNGIDSSRRIKLIGFCQSIEFLYENVESAISRRGGEVLAVDRKVKSGVHECLNMALAVPLLFGVPPQQDHLKASIESGGGVIDRVYKEWFIL